MPVNPKQLKTAKNLIPSQAGSQSYIGKVGEDKPERYYKFRIGQASNLSLSMTGLKADANLELLNHKGRTIDRSSQKGRLKESITQSLDKGVYYVRVSQRRGDTQYRLSLAVDAVGSQVSASSSSLVLEVLNLTNTYRQQAGLSPLQLNQKLNAAAQAHSGDMALNDFFSHTGSNGSSAFDRIDGAGYDYRLAAENIAAGYATPNSVVQAWMNSPGHRANILNAGLKEIGIGFYLLPTDPGTANYRYYWTQDFGTL